MPFIFLAEFNMAITHYSLHGTEMDHTFHLKPLLTAAVFHDAFARLNYELETSAIHLEKLGLSWVLSDMHLEFEGKLPYWREPYSVEVWVRKNQQVRIFADFIAINGYGEAFARGTSVWLVIDQQTRQPVIKPDLLNRFTIENRAAIPGFRFSILPESGTVINTATIRIGVNDIDFNLHLNSVRYLGGGIDALGKEFLFSHRLKAVTVKYMKEVLCEEVVTVVNSRLENGTILHQIYSDSEEEVCRFISRWAPY